MADGAAQVLAERDISAAEELTITYGSTKDNREMMLSYGFVPAGGNSMDRVAGLMGLSASPCTASSSGAAAAFSPALSRSRKNPIENHSYLARTSKHHLLNLQMN